MSRWDTHISPYLQEIERWARRGLNNENIAEQLGIGYSTFRKYIKEHPELNAILVRGRQESKRIVQKALRENDAPAVKGRGISSTGALGFGPGLHVRPDQQGTHRAAFERNKKRIYATQDVCGICGRPVDKKLKYPHPMSPCIDHIIPIAKGGHPSAIENLQLAHWSCNRQKSDKMSVDIESANKGDILSNRILPLSTDWSAYKAKD